MQLRISYSPGIVLMAIVREENGVVVTSSKYTPELARKLSQALIMAADGAEGNPPRRPIGDNGQTHEN